MTILFPAPRYLCTIASAAMAIIAVSTFGTSARAEPNKQIIERAQQHKDEAIKLWERLVNIDSQTGDEEGLVIAGPLHTLLDGDPRNNFVKRAGSFNEGGALSGATSMTIAGTTAYVTTPRGIVVLGLDDPVKPRILAQVGAPVEEPMNIWT